MPKGGASSLTPVHAGLRDDLEDFLKAFLKLNSLRFVDYKRLFETRGMIQLFNGRSDSAEIVEFNECLLVHCLPYMEQLVCPGTPRSLNEQLFGLYSLYTFFHVQQENHVVKCRVDPDAARNFRRLTELTKQERIYDAYMICLNLLENEAFKQVAFLAIHDPTNFKRFYTDGKVSGVSVQVNQNDPLVRIKEMLKSDTFNELELIHNEYTRLKKDANFDGYLLSNITEEVKSSLDRSSLEIESKSGVEEIISTDYSMEQLNSRRMCRSKIRDQAHSSDLKFSRSRRHCSTTPTEMPTDTFEFKEDVEDLADLAEMVEFQKKRKRRTRRGLLKKLIKSKASEIEKATESVEVPDVIEPKLEIPEAETNVEPLKMEEIIREEDMKQEEPDEDDNIKEKTNEILYINGTLQIFNTENLKTEDPEERLMILEDDDKDYIETRTSIIKTPVKKNHARHVSFRETQDGKVAETIHEISPNRSEDGISPKTSEKSIEQSTGDFGKLTSQEMSSENNVYNIIDDDDMFGMDMPEKMEDEESDGEMQVDE